MGDLIEINENRMKKYDLAIKDLLQAISIDNSSYSHGMLSHVYFDVKDIDKSLESANKSIELNSAYQVRFRRTSLNIRASLLRAWVYQPTKEKL